MKLFKFKSEKEKNIKTLYDEILRLSEQMNSVKKKMEDDFPLFDTLNKIKEEIEELKKKTNKLEQYKSNAESLSKQIDELKQNDEKETKKRWPLRLSLCIGLSFFVLSIIIVWMLFFNTPYINVKVNESIPMLIVGATIYFIMAVILVLFAYQSRHFFNCKENNNNKK